MSSKIYVGGLPYATTDAQLQDLFSTHGTVESARVITDKFTGRSRGFGFVEMASNEEAQKAIQALNGTDLDGRKLQGDRDPSSEMLMRLEVYRQRPDVQAVINPPEARQN